jgi:hypothetical protein
VIDLEVRDAVDLVREELSNYVDLDAYAANIDALTACRRFTAGWRSCSRRRSKIDLVSRPHNLLSPLYAGLRDLVVDRRG